MRNIHCTMQRCMDMRVFSTIYIYMHSLNSKIFRQGTCKGVWISLQQRFQKLSISRPQLKTGKKGRRNLKWLLLLSTLSMAVTVGTCNIQFWHQPGDCKAAGKNEATKRIRDLAESGSCSKKLSAASSCK